MIKYEYSGSESPAIPMRLPSKYPKIMDAPTSELVNPVFFKFTV